jgi:hypothetical protein
MENLLNVPVDLKFDFCKPRVDDFRRAVYKQRCEN